MRKILESKSFYKIIAVFIAIFLWFYANSLENPIVVRTFQVPLTYSSMRAGMIRDEAPASVEVRVQGNWTVINPLSVDAFLADVDLSRAERGRGSYPVQVFAPAGAQLVHVRPMNVDVILEEMSSVVLPIRAVATSASPAGYSYMESEVRPQVIQVRGRLDVLESLSYGRVSYDLAGVTGDFTAESTVDLINLEGEEVPQEDLTVTPSSVEIQVVVYKQSVSKDVPIQAIFDGPLRSEMIQRTITLNPDTVKITAPEEIISQITYVYTESFDITDIDESTSLRVFLDLPENIESADALVTQVSIETERLTGTRNFENIPINYRNLFIGLNATLQETTATVTLEGEIRELMQLEKETVKLFVDLKDLQVGEHIIDALVQNPDAFRVVTVEPTRIHVTINENP